MSDFEEMENPLYNCSVLETFFSVMPLDDLKSCRLVCKLWKIETLRSLRKRTCIDLNTRSKLTRFLHSEESKVYYKFSFKLCEWNTAVSSYLANIKPSSIEVRVKLFLNKEDNGMCLLNLEDLLLTQSASLVKLVINVDSAGTLRLIIPEKLLSLTYPLLRELCVINEHMNVDWLYSLWTSITRNSSKLKVLDFRNMTSESLLQECLELTIKNLNELTYVHNKKSSVQKMHQQLNQYPISRELKRLRISFQDINEKLLTNVLTKLPMLEILEFYTQDESALSPITFPVMPNLRVLDAGNAQFSFPTVNSNVFPKLLEIKATYWDWVYTHEQLPDVHYYWRTSDPHIGVTGIHLRFPSWTALNLHYARLENFNDFIQVISAKFPSACNFTIHNVPVCEDVQLGLQRWSEVFEFRVRTWRIASFCSSEVTNTNPFIMSVDESSDQPRALETLDFGTGMWSKIWQDNIAIMSNLHMGWVGKLVKFENLKVLKLLWVKNLFSTLKLLNEDVLPNLSLLEFVGNVCINRFDRASVRRARPQLRLCQNRSCYCSDEDWWYINDPDSSKSFEKLFSYSKSCAHI